MAIAYSARYELDGRIDGDWIDEKIPVRKDRHATVKALVDAGLVERADSGFVIHDYLAYNLSREQAEERRAKDAERQREWRDKHAGSQNGRSSRGRRDRGEQSRESRANDFAWCQEHLPDLPVELAASALARVRMASGPTTPDLVRARVLSQNPDLKADS